MQTIVEKMWILLGQRRSVANPVTHPRFSIKSLKHSVFSKLREAHVSIYVGFFVCFYS